MILLAAVATTAVPANAAERYLGPVGGNGGGSFRDICPPGHFLTGLETRSGAWLDQVRGVCRPYNPQDRRFGTTGYAGPARGGNGGGPAYIHCNGFIHQWYLGVHRIDVPGASNIRGYVNGIMLACESGESGSGQTPCPATGGPRNCLPHLEATHQLCPKGQAVVGFAGRAGAYVDSLGLICNDIPVVAPPQATAPVTPLPVPNPVTDTIRTGSSRAADAIRSTLPPAGASAATPARTASSPPPPSSSSSLTPPATSPAPTAGNSPMRTAHAGSFAGRWSTRTDKNWTYEITFRQSGREVDATYVAQDGSRGTIKGRVESNVLQFRWKQEGGFEGTGRFLLAADGNSFSGAYQARPHPKLTDPRYLQGTWAGTRR